MKHEAMEKCTTKQKKSCEKHRSKVRNSEKRSNGTRSNQKKKGEVKNEK
jgi:hypothetical protein